MPQPALSREEAERRIAAINEALTAGRRPPGLSGQGDGAIATAAVELEMSITTLMNSLRSIKKNHGIEPDWSLYKPPAPEYVIKGRSTLADADGALLKEWTKTRLAGRPDDEVVHLPDPKKIVGTATLYDQTGAVTQQWVKEKADDAAREALWREFAAGLADDLPRVEPIPAPSVAPSDLLAVFPVGDHHMGMLSWGPETGAEYDLKIAENLLGNASEHLIAAAPQADVALIPFLGDFAHYDSFQTVTPTSRNLLDSDTRFPKMLRASTRAMRRMIDAALRRFPRVHVIVEIGNHDLATSISFMELLATAYEREPRVTVDTSPMHYHYFRFGEVLIGTHHGHGAKLQELPLIMATDRPEDWGATRHRHWLTGHIHHAKKREAMTAQDFPGCTVESVRVLPPVDAWAHQKGYRAMRDMTSIIFHRVLGEQSRNKVNPGMFQVVEVAG